MGGLFLTFGINIHITGKCSKNCILSHIEKSQTSPQESKNKPNTEVRTTKLFIIYHRTPSLKILRCIVSGYSFCATRNNYVNTEVRTTKLFLIYAKLITVINEIVMLT